jgi:hypothetical protein
MYVLICMYVRTYSYAQAMMDLNVSNERAAELEEELHASQRHLGDVTVSAAFARPFLTVTSIPDLDDDDDDDDDDA